MNLAKYSCILSLCTALGMFFTPSACAEKIGLSFPNHNYPKWKTDAKVLKEGLEADGHTVKVLLAEDNPDLQIKQIESLIDDGCEILVINPINSYGLSEVLKKAKAKNIRVIAYDRLIMNSEAVNYYASFDNYRVGMLQAKYIEEKLLLKDDSVSPKHIEFFSGDVEDNNTQYLWNGAKTILEPYLNSGKLVCLSGQNKMAQTSTPGWYSKNAKERMDGLLSEFNYGTDPDKQKLDAVLAENDSIARGVLESLVKSGHYTKDNIPVVTGQDCTLYGLKLIRRGLQAMCVFKDSRVLAEQVKHMIGEIVANKAVTINDTTSYDNGEKVVPAFLCTPYLVDKDSYRELILDTGYYSYEDVK